MGQALTKKKKNRKVHKYEPKEEYFIKNGNILLEKQIALGHGRNTAGGGGLKIVSANDIQSAISHYPDPYLVMDSGFQRGIGYKGSMDGRVVWIWVSRQHHEPNLILTEAAIRMVMNHNNLGKLYGCCLETFVPILVYEFLSLQKLSQHLHGSLADNKHLKWVDCLRVATETSYALSYMHNALLKPVVHRAISSNILCVVDSLHAKLGGFAYSIMIDPADTTRRWPVEGIPGYIDPEYIETQVVTDKCDVYSFGVLMLEILTRKDPHAMALAGKNLVTEFGSAKERNSMMDMIDPEVVEQASSSEIEQVARLALTCVASKGVERPTMIEVVTKLWEIQGQY